MIEHEDFRTGFYARGAFVSALEMLGAFARELTAGDVRAAAEAHRLAEACADLAFEATEQIRAFASGWAADAQVRLATDKLGLFFRHAGDLGGYRLGVHDAAHIDASAALGAAIEGRMLFRLASLDAWRELEREARGEWSDEDEEPEP